MKTYLKSSLALSLLTMLFLISLGTSLLAKSPIEITLTTLASALNKKDGITNELIAEFRLADRLASGETTVGSEGVLLGGFSVSEISPRFITLEARASIYSNGDELTRTARYKARMTWQKFADLTRGKRTIFHLSGIRRPLNANEIRRYLKRTLALPYSRTDAEVNWMKHDFTVELSINPAQVGTSRVSVSFRTEASMQPGGSWDEEYKLSLSTPRSRKFTLANFTCAEALAKTPFARVFYEDLPKIKLKDSR